MKGTGQGYRKAILINEHFVVYGVAAIAVPILRPVEAVVTVQPGRGIRLFEKGARGQTESQDPDLLGAVQRLVRGVGATEKEHLFQIVITGELQGWSGLGSSAALCVSVTRALFKTLGLADDDSEINRIAYQGEKVFASNPSGIDNTVATYGKPVLYQRGNKEPFQFIGSANPIWLVVGNSGIPSLTKDQVGKVGRFKDAFPQEFDRLCEEAAQLGGHGREALEEGDLARLGLLMNKGHGLLGRLGVSHEVLDEMVACCRNQGALGSKLTGAGGGGCILALAQEEKQGGELVRTLEDRGWEAFCVRVAMGD